MLLVSKSHSINYTKFRLPIMALCGFSTSVMKPSNDRGYSYLPYRAIYCLKYNTVLLDAKIIIVAARECASCIERVYIHTLNFVWDSRG